jgi:hypothetical protein
LTGRAKHFIDSQVSGKEIVLEKSVQPVNSLDAIPLEYPVQSSLV